MLVWYILVWWFYLAVVDCLDAQPSRLSTLLTDLHSSFLPPSFLPSSLPPFLFSLFLLPFSFSYISTASFLLFLLPSIFCSLFLPLSLFFMFLVYVELCRRVEDSFRRMEAFAQGEVTGARGLIFKQVKLDPIYSFSFFNLYHYLHRYLFFYFNLYFHRYFCLYFYFLLFISRYMHIMFMSLWVHVISLKSALGTKHCVRENNFYVKHSDVCFK